MGLKTTTTATGGGTDLTVVGGKWTIRVPEGTEGAKSRKLTKGKNEGQLVWEMKYPAVEGFIMSGKLEDNEHIHALEGKVSLMDFGDNEEFTLSLSADSRYLKTFIKCLPNIDPDKEVSLEFYQRKKKSAAGNLTYGMRVVQGGKSVDDYYGDWKKDEAGNNVYTVKNGMPDRGQGRSGDDYRDQDEFLFKKFEEFFTDYIPPHPEQSYDDRPPISDDQAPAEPEPPVLDEEDKDQIPF